MRKIGSRKLVVFIVLIIVVALIAHLVSIVGGYSLPLLRPSGEIANRQKDLIIFTVLLSLIVIIPVYYMLYSFMTKYSDKNHKHQKYQPELDNHVGVEILWWAIPVLLITILGVVTYKTSHSLDPFKPLDHPKQPLTVQVVALPWKWLFIYPEQKIASINYVKIPVDRPVNFKITSDAPMNSFWIPDLGGQIYAMAGMESQINLIANKPGEYPGLSANLSGEGFADMKFVASAVADDEFNNWLVSSASSDKLFNQSSYDELVKPSKSEPVSIYRLGDGQIFQNVINKFMAHKPDSHNSEMPYNELMEGAN